jgi:Aspartyl protease
MPTWKSCLLLAVLAFTCNPVRGAGKQDEISFKLVQGFAIVMHGEIGRLANLNILLDTGAVPSVLNMRTARQLDVTGITASFALLHKDIDAQYVTVDLVHVGWIRATRLAMVVVDLTRLEQVLGIHIDAIVGLDALAGSGFAIDYKHAKITRERSGTMRHVVPIEIRTAVGAPYWVVPISLGGQLLHVLLDTGANHLGIFEGHVAGLTLDPTILQANLISDTNLKMLRPALLFMGDTALKPQTATLLGEPPGGPREIDGVLGPTALEITRIEFDWEHHCLRWNAE